jgi:hypothetical protein
MDLAGVMTIGMIPLTALQRRRENYRKMGDADRRALEASVKRFGFKSFILVTYAKDEGKFEVLDGHHRWETAEKKGFETIPAVVLTREQAGDGGLDLAMLSFNVSAEILPDVYIDFIQDLNTQMGHETVAEFTGLDPAFLQDLDKDMEAIGADIGSTLQGAGQGGGSDGSRGTATAVFLPATDKVKALLEAACKEFNVGTNAEAIVLALEEVFGEEKA